MIKQTTKQRWKQAVTVWIVILSFGAWPVWANADEESELNFFVTPILPDSQLEGGATGYFDLNLDAGEQEELQLRIQNTTAAAIEVEVSAHTAYTNVNGVVEYGRDAETPDPTLPASIGDLIEAPGVITLEANEEQIVSMTLTMPEEPFEGVLAGSIRIIELIDRQRTAEEGVGIRNDFSFIVGVVASNHRTVTEPGLELLEVFADQVNYRNVFSATIQNYTPTFVNHLEVEAEVRASGSDEVLYEAHRTGMQMAPNSHMHFPISLQGNRFRSGDYLLTMVARSGDDVWEWEQEFRVDAADARRLNEEDVTLEPETNWWLIGGVIVMLLLTIFVVVLIIMKKKNAKEGGDR
ncbi:WxL protein host-binding domain-containing protein [Enterococcus casseliflavus]|uniref:WxL protein host-binding domain-containing protein n=1 Tax=Enterococcus casseliflavus TaxID=37734 RepID=UPI001432E799|nr:DUF3324 domain-containing protein [Enterococcus casseliflavus]